MYLKKIYIKNIESNFEFSKDINIISIEDDLVFHSIAFALGNISSRASREFDFNILEITGIETSVIATGDFSGKEITWNRDYRGEKINNDNGKITENPIVVYYGNRVLDVFKNNYNDKNEFDNDIKYLYDNCMDKYGFLFSQKNIAKMFIERIKMICNGNTNNKKFEFLNFHCENLKRIVNNIINILNFDGFDFNIVKRCFTFKKNSITMESTRCFSIHYLISMCLDLYFRCMIKNPNELDSVVNADGVAIINFNFGERPSYSDNKWKYYNVLKDTFKNIQLIAL